MTSTTIHRVQVPPMLDARSTGELADTIERAIAEPRGVIVLAGGDGTFCRGIDPHRSPASLRRTVTSSIVKACSAAQWMVILTVATAMRVRMGLGGLIL